MAHCKRYLNESLVGCNTALILSITDPNCQKKMEFRHALVAPTEHNDRAIFYADIYYDKNSE